MRELSGCLFFAEEDAQRVGGRVADLVGLGLERARRVRDEGMPRGRRKGEIEAGGILGVWW